LTPTYLSIITTSSNFPAHTRQDRVFLTPREMMRASRCSNESTLEDGVPHSFGSSLL